jgi:hypothetical protein
MSRGTGVPAWSRRQSAIFKVVSTISVSLMPDACHPTTAREKTSIAKATYINPDHVLTYVKSVTHTAFGRAAEVPVQQIRSPLLVLRSCTGFGFPTPDEAVHGFIPHEPVHGPDRVPDPGPRRHAPAVGPGPVTGERIRASRARTAATNAMPR